MPRLTCLVPLLALAQVCLAHELYFDDPDPCKSFVDPRSSSLEAAHLALTSLRSAVWRRFDDPGASPACPFRADNVYKASLAKVSQVIPALRVSDSRKPVRAVKCLLCQKIFVSFEYLEQHLRERHASDSARPAVRTRRSLVCPATLLCALNPQSHWCRLDEADEPMVGSELCAWASELCFPGESEESRRVFCARGGDVVEEEDDGFFARWENEISFVWNTLVFGFVFVWYAVSAWIRGDVKRWKLDERVSTVGGKLLRSRLVERLLGLAQYRRPSRVTAQRSSHPKTLADSEIDV